MSVDADGQGEEIDFEAAPFLVDLRLRLMAEARE